MRQDQCIIGLDAGTSVVKAVLFDGQGRELGLHQIDVAPDRPHPLWAEQDMAMLWGHCETCIRRVADIAREMGRTVAGIGITSTGDGTWMIDKAGDPVRPGILWCDGRAGRIIERWHAGDTAARAFAICGTSVFAGSQAAQLCWLRENEPESLEKAAVIFHAKDWLFYKLTGKITSDETDESLTMLGMTTRRYDPELFRIFQIDDLFEKFPTVVSTVENVGTILPAVAQQFGLSRDLMVGSGPMDVAACALGTGAIESLQASSILGTAGIHQLIMDRPLLEPKMVGMTLCHGVTGKWMRMMAAMTATPNLDWFVREPGRNLREEAHAAGESIFERLERDVRTVPVGSEGVMYHPYLSPGGERGPFVKPSARASFTGLTMNHGIRHMLRAVYEGVALATLDCYRHMPEQPEIVYLSGGGSRSGLWCQMMADCLGTPVSIPDGSQYGAKGAAINLGIAMGCYKDAAEAVDHTIRQKHHYLPRTAQTSLYAELYELYHRTCESQMDLWDLRSDIFLKRGNNKHER
jgi:sugar (pentulose or hexulose) kinase